MRHGRLDHRQVWAQYAAGQLPAEIGPVDGPATGLVVRPFSLGAGPFVEQLHP
jgi:hypothetical protein